MITIKVNTAGLKKFQEELKHVELQFASKTMRGAMSESAEVLKQELYARVPVGKTGHLRQSVRATVYNRKRFVVGKVSFGDKIAYYARFIEKGTKKHTIKPGVQRALRIGGKFYGVVQHPGMKRQQPLMFAVYASKPAVITALETGIEKRLANAVKM